MIYQQQQKSQAIQWGISWIWSWGTSKWILHSDFEILKRQFLVFAPKTKHVQHISKHFGVFRKLLRRMKIFQIFHISTVTVKTKKSGAFSGIFVLWKFEHLKEGADLSVSSSKPVENTRDWRAQPQKQKQEQMKQIKQIKGAWKGLIFEYLWNYCFFSYFSWRFLRGDSEKLRRLQFKLKSGSAL